MSCSSSVRSDEVGAISVDAGSTGMKENVLVSSFDLSFCVVVTGWKLPTGCPPPNLNPLKLDKALVGLWL